MVLHCQCPFVFVQELEYKFDDPRFHTTKKDVGFYFCGYGHNCLQIRGWKGTIVWLQGKNLRKVYELLRNYITIVSDPRQKVFIWVMALTNQELGAKKR